MQCACLSLLILPLHCLCRWRLRESGDPYAVSSQFVRKAKHQASVVMGPRLRGDDTEYHPIFFHSTRCFARAASSFGVLMIRSTIFCISSPWTGATSKPALVASARNSGSVMV